MRLAMDRGLWGAGLATALAIFAPAWSARAEPERFGEAGQTVVFGSIGAYYQVRAADMRVQQARVGDLGVRQDTSDKTNVEAWLAPGAFRFVADDLAFGLALDVGYASLEARDFPVEEWTAGLHVGGAYNVLLTQDFSLLPSLWLGAGYIHSTRGQVYIDEFTLSGFQQEFVLGERSEGDLFLSGQVQVQLLWHFAPSTYLSFGGRLSHLSGVTGSWGYSRGALMVGVGRWLS